MKLKCDKKKLKKINKLLDFYKNVERGYEKDWFAWFPVRVGINDSRWLETVTTKYKMRRDGVELLREVEVWLKEGWLDYALGRLQYSMGEYVEENIVAKS